MIKFLNQEIELNTITEINAFYDMKIHQLLFDACRNVNSNIKVIDTKGNFLLSNMECSYVNNVEEYMEELAKYANMKDCILIIDCITFILDDANKIDHLKRSINIFWDLIYSNNATIIYVNHYYQIKIMGEVKHLPRLGQFWRLLISNRYNLIWKNSLVAIDDV